jgi:hypothetical protein
MEPQRAVQSGDAYYYEKTGEIKGNIAQWEDGYRTKGLKGAFEWWYFDSHLHDGSSLVITFFASSGKRGLPRIDVDYTLADGTFISEKITVSEDNFHASTESCDVRIGDCTFKGNLHTYDIFLKNDKLEISVQLIGNVPAWRPETGFIFFGNKDEHYFAWLPAVPEGTVNAVITTNGKTFNLSGTGYHDHNWGNSMIMMAKMINNWYWGRAKIGNYQVISSYITSGKKYGYKKFPIFMLAKEGQIIADDSEHFLHFTATDLYVDKDTKKPVHNCLIYDYDDGKQHYRITYQRKSDLSNKGKMGEVTGMKRLLMRLIGLDSAYIRFSGEATVDKFEGDTVVEKVSAPAIWELMYVGKTPSEREEGESKV